MATRKKTSTRVKAKPTATARTKNTTRKSTKNVAAPSYDAIAERAWCLWNDNGCQSGQEEHNWFEAVAQLTAEPVSC